MNYEMIDHKSEGMGIIKGFNQHKKDEKYSRAFFLASSIKIYPNE